MCERAHDCDKRRLGVVHLYFCRRVTVWEQVSRSRWKSRMKTVTLMLVVVLTTAASVMTVRPQLTSTSRWLTTTKLWSHQKLLPALTSRNHLAFRRSSRTCRWAEAEQAQALTLHQKPEVRSAHLRARQENPVPSAPESPPSQFAWKWIREASPVLPSKQLYASARKHRNLLSNEKYVTFNYFPPKQSMQMNVPCIKCFFFG